MTRRVQRRQTKPSGTALRVANAQLERIAKESLLRAAAVREPARVKEDAREAIEQLVREFKQIALVSRELLNLNRRLLRVLQFQTKKKAGGQPSRREELSGDTARRLEEMRQSRMSPWWEHQAALRLLESRLSSLEKGVSRSQNTTEWAAYFTMERLLLLQVDDEGRRCQGVCRLRASGCPSAQDIERAACARTCVFPFTTKKAAADAAVVALTRARVRPLSVGKWTAANILKIFNRHGGKH